MSQISQIVCDACLRPLTEESEVKILEDVENDEAVCMTVCLHLYHRSCIVDAIEKTNHPERLFTCKHEDCGKNNSESQICNIETTQGFINVDPSDSQDEIAELQASNAVLKDISDRMQNELLTMEKKLSAAEEQNSQLERQLNLANMKYEKLAGMKLFGRSCSSSSESSKPFPLITKDESANLPPLFVDFTRETRNVNQYDNRTSANHYEIDSKTINPSGSSALKRGRSPLIIQDNRTRPYIIHPREPQHTSQDQAHTRGRPPLIQDTTTRPPYTIHPREPQHPSQDQLPAVNDTIELCAEQGKNHKRFITRYGSSSEDLRPFYPQNAYPEYFTWAGIMNNRGECTGAIFAYNILIIGDTHAYSLAKYILRGKPYEHRLNADLYKTQLTIAELLSTLTKLSKFTRLPSRIMMSIGNYDIFLNTSQATFYCTMTELAQLFKRKGVKEVFVLLPIPYKGQNEIAYKTITSVLDRNWREIGDFRYIMASKYLTKLTPHQPTLTDAGPVYDRELYVHVANRIKEDLIPEVAGEKRVSTST